MSYPVSSPGPQQIPEQLAGCRGACGLGRRGEGLAAHSWGVGPPQQVARSPSPGRGLTTRAVCACLHREHPQPSRQAARVRLVFLTLTF